MYEMGHRREQAQRVIALIALLLAPVARADGGSPPEARAPLDLEALTQAAEGQSYDLAAAHHKRMAAEAQLDEATFSPFFQFRAEGGLAIVPDATGVPGYTRDSPNQLNNGFGPAIQGKLKGAIPLWTFGKLSAARDAAEYGIDAAEHNVTRARHKLIFDVRRAYFGLQLALDARQMISEGLPKLEKARTKLEERLAEGDPEAAPQDGYRMAAAVAEVAARKSEAVRLEKSARMALETLSGKPHVLVPDCPSEARFYEPKPMAWYRQHALNNRPELAMLRAGLGARSAALAEKKARYFPDIALGVDVQSQYVPGRTPWAHYEPYFVGAALVARWELDFLGHGSRVDQAQHQLLETQAQSDLAKQGIQLEVGDKYEQLQDARRRLDAWEMGHQSARRWFVSAAQGHQVGTTTAKELIDGVTAYFKARFAHLQAIHDYNVALAALELSVGAPLLARDAWNLRCDMDLEAGPISSDAE